MCFTSAFVVCVFESVIVLLYCTAHAGLYMCVGVNVNAEVSGYHEKSFVASGLLYH